MQTRRKSLNLGDLGVVAPKRSRAPSHPSPPATIVEGEEPPIKRTKRSHTSTSPPLTLMSPPRTTTIRFKEERSKPASELSPPPSPVTEGSSKIDTEGINDDIVIGAIRQLEKTGNRPHLVKDLAAVLAMNLHIVEKSANPSALISSRLTAYLHRSWPAISPCPLAKDLSPVHPRRLYFYLTTSPHQQIPDHPPEPPKPNRIISPSLSSAADEEDPCARDRHVMSPSPEVDLSSPEFDAEQGDAPATAGASFSERDSIPRDATNYSHNRRAASPPLETAERDFKQTASAVYEQTQARRNSSQDSNMDDTSAGADDESMNVTMSIESEESAARKNSEAAAALFGATEHLKLPFMVEQHLDLSSPMLPPIMEVEMSARTKHVATERHEEAMHLDLSEEGLLPDAAFAFGHLQSPENIDLEELDLMFDAY